MYRVLIVEDDPMVAMINAQYVSRNKKFKVVGHCKDGVSALEFLEKNDADLIILDVFMPYMNGIETLHEIRARKKKVEVIMVTAANDLATLEETIHLGVIDYLVKPFDFDRFRLALDKFDAQAAALKGVEVVNQQSVDNIIEGLKKNAGEQQPKGIQEKTVELIMDYVRSCGGRWLSGDEIAENVGLSGVTVRRYMNHLVRTGAVTGEMNYETGGRPCMLFKETL